MRVLQIALALLALCLVGALATPLPQTYVKTDANSVTTTVSVASGGTYLPKTYTSIDANSVTTTVSVASGGTSLPKTYTSIDANSVTTTIGVTGSSITALPHAYTTTDANSVTTTIGVTGSSITALPHAYTTTDANSVTTTISVGSFFGDNLPTTFTKIDANSVTTTINVVGTPIGPLPETFTSTDANSVTTTLNVFDATHLDVPEVYTSTDANSVTTTIEVYGIGAGGNTVPIAVLTYSPLNPVTGQTVTLDASGSYDLNTGDTLQYQFKCKPGDAWSTWGAATTFSCNYATADTYTASVQVTDSMAYDTASVDITVAAANQPPVAALSYTPANPVVPATVTLDASDSSDNENQALQYNFSCSPSGPHSGWVTSTTYSCAYSAAGTYTASVNVTDGALYDTASVSIPVTSNQPPTVTLGYTPPDPVAPAAVGLTATASDTDGPSALQYNFSCTPSGPHSGWQSSNAYACTYAAAGSYVASVNVTDSINYVAASATIVVSPAPLPPVPSLTHSPASPRAPVTVTLDASGTTDPDTPLPSLRYWFHCNETDAGPGWQAGTTHSCFYGADGVFKAIVNVTDQTFVVSTFDYVVVSANQPPACSAPTATPNPVYPGEATTLAVSATDPEGDALTCLWDMGPLGTVSVPGCTAITQNPYSNFLANVSATDGISTTNCGAVDVVVSCGAGGVTIDSATAVPSSGNPPLAVLWSALSSGDDTGWQYGWAFTDGAGAVGKQVTHTITQTTTGTVAATEPATGCASNSKSVTATVTPVETAFANFTGIQSTGNIASYDWNFADTHCAPQPSCSQAAGVNATHTYTVAGDYDVTLVVHGTSGGTDTDHFILHVEE